MNLTKEQREALYKMASPELKQKMDLENMQNNSNGNNPNVNLNDFANIFGDNNLFSNMFNQKK